MALTWNDLFLSGSIVDLHVSRWTARVRITAADLGIGDSDAVAQALALGTHRLAPASAFEAIGSIHAKVRRTIDHYSLSFGFIKGARYVPEKNLAELSERLREHRAAWDAAVADLVGNYAKIQSDHFPVLEQALRDAAKTPESAATAIERLRAEYPSADQVREMFALRWNVYAIQGPRKAGAEAALEAEQEAVRGVVIDMVKDLRAEMTVKLADVLSLIQKGGKLQPRSVEAALAVIDHIENVNVLGDEVLAAQARALRAALRGLDTAQRVPDSTIVGLEDIKKALVTDIAEAALAAERKLTGVGRRKLAKVA